MTKKYFLHIPRTSGRSVINQLHLSGIKIRYSDTHSYNSDIPKFIMYDDEVLTGHLGASPIMDCAEISAFTIIRNPVDHFRSVISYASIGMSAEDKEKIAKQMLVGNSKQFPFIRNMQSTFLISRFKILPYEKFNLEFKEWKTWTMARIKADILPTNFEQVLNFIKSQNIKIYTIENRNKMIKEVLAFFGINRTPPNVNIGKNEIDPFAIEFCAENYEKIQEANMIDFELFTKETEAQK